MIKLYYLLRIHNQYNQLRIFFNQLTAFLVKMSLLVIKGITNVLINKLLILILDKIKLVIINNMKI